MRPLITLTTDFGDASPYVAQMKGVILSICRDVDLVDISHALRPQDVRQAAIILGDAAPRFPADTLHLAVVDPGVGTSRRIIYAELAGQRYIAPDNGLLSYLARKQTPQPVISIEDPAYWLPAQASTFHGRDIMAPVAARLAAGLGPNKLGPVLNDLVKLTWPVAARSRGQLQGEVLIVDSFGNLITNIEQPQVLELGQPDALRVRCASITIRGLVHAYGAAMSGEMVALFDSQGRLEIASVGGNAAQQLGVSPGAAVIVSER